MNWKTQVQKQLSSAAEASGLEPWGGTDTRFWQLGLQFPETIIQAASSYIASAADAGHGLAEKSVLAILMAVLRSDLAGVRANYLWPEVAGYFNDQSGIEVSHGIYAARFREALGTIFPSQLAEIEHHHRYVMLLLDEAGIGHDRSAIIMEFLLHLCEMDDISGGENGEIEQIVLEKLERFTSKTHSRGDVEALWRVLLRAGTTVIHIRQALQDYPDPLELQFWQWDDLRQFWQSTTGEQLETLLPEARQVFNALIPHFGKIISCDQVYALIRDGDISVELPRENSALPASSDDIPLGRIIFSRNNSHVEARTMDALGLTSDVVRKSMQDRWCRIGANGYYIWGEEPFHVLIDDYSRYNTREIYSVLSDHLDGYIWSGRLRGDQSAAVEESGLGLERSPAVLPQYSWRYEAGGPKLKFMGVKVLHHDGLKDAKVIVAEQVVWKGDIDAGTRMVLPEKKFKNIAIDSNAAISGIRVEVYSGEELFGYREIRLPQYPFAVINGRPLKPGPIDACFAGESGFGGSVLIVPAGSGKKIKPITDSGEFVSYQDIPIPSGTMAFRLNAKSNQDIPRRMVFAGHEWTLTGDTPSIRVDALRNIKIGPVTIHGTGSIHPVSSDATDMARLCIDGEIDNSNWALRLNTGSVTNRYALQPNTPDISFSSVLARAPAALHRSVNGLIRVELLHHGKLSGQPHYLYVVGSNAIPEVARPDKQARVIFSGLQLKDQIITSDKLLRHDGDSATCTLVFPEVHDMESASGVTFIWKPECRGLRLSSGDTSTLMDLFDLGQAGSAILMVIGSTVGWSMQVSFNVGEERLKSKLLPLANTNNSLLGILNELAFDVFPAEMRYVDCLTLEGMYEREMFHRWALDLSACGVKLDVQEQLQGASQGIYIEAAWTGLAHREVTVVAKESDEWMSVPHAIQSHTGNPGIFEHSGKTYIPLADDVIGLKSSRVIDIELLEEGRLITSRQITLKATAKGKQESREDLKNQIQSLINLDEAITGTTEDTISRVVFLVERYVLNFDEIPYDAARLEAVIRKSFQVTEQSGRILTCLIARMELVERSEVPDVRPEPVCGPTSMDVLENTLLLHVLAREKQSGTLDPGNAFKLLENLKKQRSALSESPGRDWVVCLQYACQRLMGDNDPVESGDRRSVSESLLNPVFSIGHEVKCLLL